MTQFTFTIRDELGIHARPAGLLAKLVKGYADTTVIVAKDGKEAKASQLMKLMSLGVKKGDVVTVSAEGGDEAAVIGALKKFFEENL
ncbi:MAG: HPr family phosphocarrier protein [Faecousia sp.]